MCGSRHCHCACVALMWDAVTWCMLRLARHFQDAGAYDVAGTLACMSVHAGKETLAVNWRSRADSSGNFKTLEHVMW